MHYLHILYLLIIIDYLFIHYHILSEYINLFDLFIIMKFIYYL